MLSKHTTSRFKQQDCARAPPRRALPASHSHSNSHISLSLHTVLTFTPHTLLHPLTPGVICRIRNDDWDGSAPRSCRYASPPTGRRRPNPPPPSSPHPSRRTAPAGELAPLSRRALPLLQALPATRQVPAKGCARTGSMTSRRTSPLRLGERWMTTNAAGASRVQGVER